MTYIRVKRMHSSPDQPVLLYSELDNARREVRKVEVFADGRLGFARAGEHGGGTELGKAPLPPSAEIASDSQFEPVVITQAEFEQAWGKWS